MPATLPYLGYGLRLRKEYLMPLLEQKPALDWLEIIAESYLGEDQETLGYLDAAREIYPMVLHSLSMAIGSPWPLDHAYLERLKQLSKRLQPAWISDHLCWSGADDLQGQLLPLPYSEETLEHTVSRIIQVQEILGRKILLENVPMEQYQKPEIPEAEFLREVAERSDSLILIDIGNLHSSSVNMGFDPRAYLRQLPAERVQQIHLAGATALCCAELDLDSNQPDPIWALYTLALELFGPVTTMVEREDTIPTLSSMVEEVRKARCAAENLQSSP